MSEPYIGEIRLFGFNFPPRGFAQCDGFLLPINQNQALYSILGTTYGGDGRTTFALPELRGRVPMHVGTGFSLGAKAGEETHVLSTGEIPNHDHSLRGTSQGANVPVPTSNLLADTAPNEIYSNSSTLVDLATGTVANTGNGQGHVNMMPSIAINFCIALTGVFPPRN